MNEQLPHNSGMPGSDDGSSAEKPLESWKEIGNYLQRDLRTAKRWEKLEGLPVRRHQHASRSSVYAYPSELDRWRAARNPSQQLTVVAVPLWRRPLPTFAFALVLLLALMAGGDGGAEIMQARAQGTGVASSAGITVRQVWQGSEVDGAVAPDGNFVSYVDWATGEIAIRDLAKGQSRNLTTGASWTSPSRFGYYNTVSPDSRKVAYTWYNRSSIGEVRIVGIEGGEPKVLYQNDAMDVRVADWSRDGKSILALVKDQLDHAFKIALLSVPEGILRVVKTLDWRWPTKMSLSPDGRFIAYDAPNKEDSPERDIFLLGLPTSDSAGTEIRLVGHPAVDWAPMWSPDGRQLFFISDRGGSAGLWGVPVEGGKLTGSPALFKGALERAWPVGFTRAGSLYYGVKGHQTDIFVAELDPVTGKAAGAPKRLVESYVGLNLAPVLSPDGKFLAFLSRRDPDPQMGLRLVIKSLNNGEERVLPGRLEHTPQPRWNGFRWSPDGKWLVTASRDGKDRSGVHRIDVKSGEVTSLGGAVNSPEKGRGPILRPVWSPDGKSIYYSREVRTPRAGKPDVIVRILSKMDLKSGEEKELMQREWGIRNLAVSPDGRQLAFATSQHISVISTAGGEPRLLHKLADPYGVDFRAGILWTPDGRFLIFAKGHGGKPTSELYRLPVAGGEPHALGIAMDDVWNLDLHRDGRRIVFSGAGPEGRQPDELWVLENLLTAKNAAR